MQEPGDPSARYVRVTGVVQGVGFRPFVYNLATDLGLSGWVLNTSSGVEIEVAGPAARLEEFVVRLRSDAPPLARVEQVAVTDLPFSGILHPAGFSIRHSEPRPGEFQPISPDVSICDDCLRELFDPTDRRYRYPFINCTNCGPRFTIIRDVPYDRPATTMAPFRMCADCQAEYDDPANRRFHAQPNACPVCGPRVWLQIGESMDLQDGRSANGQSGKSRIMGRGSNAVADEEAIRTARAMLSDGAILAVKGLGGFHLACDATSDRAVVLLRERKGRVGKPFAIMSFDLEAVQQYCRVSDEERALLASRERPIVLLRRRANGLVSPAAAPGNDRLGVMLPYTPLHYLLLEPEDGFPIALVMTSGNYSEEPIATGNDEALERLGGLADAFLFHDRDVHTRCDDSVTRVFAGAELPIRRSRGYAPYPVHLPFSVHRVLGVGAELKNTFCLARDRYAFLSQHIGDLENYETLRFFVETVEQLSRTFRVEPGVVACDLHPGYLSTRWARFQISISGITPSQISQSPLSQSQILSVQHHHAHVAACMAENGLAGERPVIGVAFDGTGYGSDGAIWGGEFLVADYRSFRRVAHLRYVPLPGGDMAIRRPYRTALAHLWAAGVEWDEDLPPVAAASAEERIVLRQQLERGLNAVPTSSAGRLFDAVSSLAGVRQAITYEAQAAIELEVLAGNGVGEPYPFDLGDEIDAAPCIRAVVADVRAGVEAGVIAARFHDGLAVLVRDVCLRLREETGLGEVALSGGVFQNVTLLGGVLPLLREAGFVVYIHRLVPPNDACISLGQAVVASKWLAGKSADHGDTGNTE
jgi:hydrogenase maturation protein HypF